jgi:hypothetical protein
MPLLNNKDRAIASLAARKPSSIVKVVVRPAQQSPVATAVEINPHEFSTPIEYRTALIARKKASTEPAKDAVVSAAQEHGLDASSAGVMNAVLVSGSAGKILQFLEGLNYDSVNLDHSI